MTVRRVAVAGLALLVAVLVLVFWSRDDERPGPDGSAGSQSYAVQLTAPAGRPAEVIVRRHDGAPLRLDAVTLEPAMPQMGHAMPAVVAERVAVDRFATRGELLAMPGQWEVLVLLGQGPDAEFVIVHVE